MLEIAFFIICGPAIVLLALFALGLGLYLSLGFALMWLFPYLGLPPLAGLLTGLLLPVGYCLLEEWVVGLRRRRAVH
jgi:hypothetical protein